MLSLKDQRKEISQKREGLFRRKRYVEASALELEYLAQHPNDARFHAKAAKTFAALRDMDSALKHQRRVVEIEPLNVNARLVLVRLYNQVGDVAAASEEQKQAERCAKIARRLFARRSRQEKAAHRDRLGRVLATVLPIWKHARSVHPDLMFGHLLDKYEIDDVPHWISYAPEPLGEGSIVKFDEIGSFRVGNGTEVVQKRLARNMPWELPTAILLMELVSRCDPKSLVLDIGANVGTLTVPLGRAFGGSVLAFEPLESNYRDLVRHLEMNSLTNVTAVQKACGRTQGSGHMVLTNDANPARRNYECPAETEGVSPK